MNNLLQTLESPPSRRNGRRGGRTTGARIISVPTGTLPPLPSAQSEGVPPMSSSQRRGRNRRARQRRNNLFMRDALTLSNIPNSTRSGLVPNPADPRTLVNALGQTSGGAAWCLKALHPCGEFDNNVPKICDGAASESVILERRDEFVVNKPDDIDNDTWTVLVVQSPFLSFGLLCVAGSPDVMIDANIQVCIQRAYAAPNETAVSPNWTTQAVAGTSLYTSFLPCAVLDGPNTGTDGVFEQYFKTIRRTYAGLTIDFDANDLTNKGRVTSGQFQAVTDIRAITVPGATADDPDTIVPVYQATRYPVDNQDIVQEDLLCRQAEARTGEYAPQRIWQPVVDFAPATSARQVHFSSVSDVDPGFPTITESKTIWLSGWGIYVSRWSDIYSSSSLRIKRKEGLELVVGRSSPYGPFNSPGYPDDPMAIRIMREFSRTQPHAYEADYNSKNLMSRGLFGSLGGILGNLGIPILSDLAPLLGGLADSLFPI